MSETETETETRPCENLWSALALAQSIVKNPTRNARNEYSKYDYCTIGSVLDVTRPALAEAGLAFIHQSGKLVNREGLLIAQHVFILAHSSGETQPVSYEIPIDGKSKAPSDKNTLAATTAIRRYALMSILNLSTGDEPDIDQRGDSVTDGQENTRPKAKTAKRTTRPKVEKRVVEKTTGEDLGINNRFLTDTAVRSCTRDANSDGEWWVIMFGSDPREYITTSSTVASFAVAAAKTGLSCNAEAMRSISEKSGTAFFRIKTLTPSGIAIGEGE